MVHCSDFIRKYSDFRDGLLSGAAHEAFTRHARECDRCARYDRVVSGGVAVLRDLPEVEPSSDFLPRLQHRVYHIEDRAALLKSLKSSAPPLAFVGVALVLLGSVAYLTDSGAAPATVELPPVMAAAPKKEYPVGTLFRAGPLLEPELPAARASATNTVFFQYTPLGAYARYEGQPIGPR